MEPLRLAKTTWLVGSGKGGVGKSTVAINLAVSLAQRGCRVGLLDADIYGPSIPIMSGLRQTGPRTTRGASLEERVTPLCKFGIRILSIGFFLEEGRALLLRGPMLHQLLTRMIQDADWGELDYLLVDLPPGTGDTPLSLSKLLAVDGALIVCTPQEVALLDALKAIHSFEQLEIPLVGLVENMAGFTDPETGKTHAIFGEGKARKFAFHLGIPLLGSIPLASEIREGGDEGVPSAYHCGERDVGSPFRSIANLLLGESHGIPAGPGAL